MNKQLLVLLSTVLLSFNAYSLFEVRVGYGVNTPSDDSIGASTLSTMAGFNLDAIIELPMMPLGLGLRYETMGMDVEGSGYSYDTDLTRTSLLVNYRFIDMFLYLGAIATIGFQNDMTLKGIPSLGDVKYDADLTYSVGVEGGVSLGLIMLGAELGYNIATYKSDNASFADATVDGVYAKALVGVGF